MTERMPAGRAAMPSVAFDQSAARSQGLEPGKAVVIHHEDRHIPARIIEMDVPASDRSCIYIDRYLREALQSHYGDAVEVEVFEPQLIKRVVVAPTMDIFSAQGLSEHIRSVLEAEKALVGMSSVLYIKFPKSSAGTFYVVEDIEPGPGLMGPDTEVVLRLSDAAKVAEETSRITFDDVGGLHREIDTLRELVELPLRFPDAYQRVGINPPRGIILYGPPGVGKTHLARAVANEVNAQFFYINGPSIVGQTYGETESNLRKMFGEATRNAPSIIFIDEIDAMAPNRNQLGSQADARMVAQFLSLLDGLYRVDGVMIVGTTNRENSIDPAFRRPGRFDREIPIMPPDSRGRREILSIHTREMPLLPETTKYLDEVAEQTHGFVGADLMELCREAGLACLRRTFGGGMPTNSIESYEPITVEKSDFAEAAAKVKPSGIRELLVGIPDVSWDDIGGLEDVKRQLHELVELPLENPGLLSSLGMHSTPGIVLSGPPGTGKTLLARALANRCQVNFIAVNGPEIFSKWLGESEEQVRRIFELARQVAPSIIFFDQLDAIAPKRAEDAASRTAERVVNQLLAELDSLQAQSRVIVLAATNRIDMVDTSVLRPGRLGVRIALPLPDEAARQKILEIELADMVGGEDDQGLIQDLARRTEGFSGAHLADLCWQAKLASLREGEYALPARLSRESFEEALERIIETSTTLQESLAN
ncbi:MAG TPA: AAA family ATPase [Dehalococcoidia bacterium]|nr:AAA family ATPase [Dehalococcoidia bacterium]